MKRFSLIIFLLLSSCQVFGAATQWVDFTLDNGHVFLPVTIDGIESRVMLDSGAQINSINRAFVRKHDLAFDKGRPVNVKGVYGVEKRKAYNNVDVEIFGTTFKLDSLVETNLGHHSNGMLLGAGFFNSFVVQLDYPHRKIRLVTRDSVNMKEVANVPATTQQGTGMPIAQVEINGVPLWLRIDTGNAGTILINRRAASKADLLEKVEGTSTSFGANSSGVNEFSTSDMVKFGPFEISNVKVSFPAEGQTTNLESQYKRTGSRIGGRRVVGLIGYDLLKDFVVTLDYRYGRLHINVPQ
ncbi:signal protein PDZ [Alteromonas mediterranea]|uniref:Signal protein PDZ n=1 Tax=Alteromonas mediterranea TaxID=314275 RepID=A0AAC9NQH5_9ALTE|nr:aspartyl protease family protein [Alteromonas mediterranea]APD89460.1 signal protein PDZ [Alteromonas mediterranea]APE01517.1 signal protein PDZ [Alteromonas mediterranea]